MQENEFQRVRNQQFSGGACPRTHLDGSHAFGARSPLTWNIFLRPCPLLYPGERDGTSFNNLLEEACSLWVPSSLVILTKILMCKFNIAHYRKQCREYNLQQILIITISNVKRKEGHQNSKFHPRVLIWVCFYSRVFNSARKSRI